MIVVDANVLAHFFIAGPKTAAARQLYDRDPDWIAPSLLAHEFLNILAMQFRLGGMKLDRCEHLWRHAATMMDGKLHETDKIQVLGLAAKYKLTAYDAQYVQLATARTLPLITEDRAILKQFPALASTIAKYLNH